jgi:hypothetical protein
MREKTDATYSNNFVVQTVGLSSPSPAAANNGGYVAALTLAAQHQHALTVSGLPAKALALARVYGVQDLLELQA